MRIPKSIDAKRILVVRTDRLGDMILSTPLIRSIAEASPRAEIVLLARRYALDALRLEHSVGDTIEWTADGAGRATLSPGELARHRFDAAILLNPGMAAGLLVLRAGIPFRTGPLARPSSFLFLNRGIRQRRSRSHLHQARLDAALAPLVTGGRARGVHLPRLILDEEERRGGRKLLESARFTPGRPVAGIHAGSGDSVLRWPEESFARMGELFVRNGWSVAYTGAGNEVELADRLARRTGEHARSLAGDRPLRLFFGLLAALDHFVAPSTGPLHAACALGVPVTAPYPPLPSQCAERWGPLGGDASTATPAVECPARIRCALEKCRYHPCMERLEPEELFRLVPPAAGGEERS